MSLPRISVVIPTVEGREDHLERCVECYSREDGTDYELELVIEHDHPSCGAGWHAGAERCTGDYIHLTCDDIAPREGWAPPAVEAVDQGFLPAPQVYGPNGQPQSLPVVGWVAPDWTPVVMTALPFMSRAQYDLIKPLFLAHYFTDDWISARGEWFHIETMLRDKYAFDHYWAQVKRGAGLPGESARMINDQKLFNEALQMVKEGRWTEAWPPNGGLPQ
jgi:hypothetical protein